MRIEALLTVLRGMARQRPVFHSEADFQHAFAWAIHLACPSAEVRLEKQLSARGARVHLDLLVATRGQQAAVELKYKTSPLSVTVVDEDFALRNQSAQDHGRHDFVRDVLRLERFVAARSGAEGIAILLTNDRTYWTETKRTSTVDSAFRLHEGRSLEGTFRWGSQASPATIRKREEAISLAGTYTARWEDYSSVAGSGACHFRFLAVAVRGDA